MKKILIAAALIVLAALIYPMIVSKRSDEGMSREASNIRQLLICVIHYTKEKNEFPETIQGAMEFAQLDERDFSEFTADSNFSYLMPDSPPQETDPYTTIIEFKMNEGIYKGYFSGHAEFFEQPKS
jgi:hypothetical protein